MTAPNIAEKVCRGTPSQSAQLPYSVVSLMRVSPTSKNTARTASGLASIRSGTPSSRHGELFVQVEDGPMILPGVCGLTKWVRLFWSDLIVPVRNCPATICGGGRGMAGVLQPDTTCSNSSRERPNTPAASLLLLRIPLAPLLSHVLVPTPTN